MAIGATSCSERFCNDNVVSVDVSFLPGTTDILEEAGMNSNFSTVNQEQKAYQGSWTSTLGVGCSSMMVRTLKKAMIAAGGIILRLDISSNFVLHSTYTPPLDPY